MAIACSLAQTKNKKRQKSSKMYLTFYEPKEPITKTVLPKPYKNASLPQSPQMTLNMSQGNDFEFCFMISLNCK